MNSAIDSASAISPGAVQRKKFAAGIIPGVILCVIITLPAMELSQVSGSLDALTLSLVMGMIIRNVIGPSDIALPGIKLVGAIFIPTGILLYGSRLNFGAFAALPGLTTATVMICIILFYTVILLGVKWAGVDRRTGLLIASGTAICGASAIAVISPVIGARSRDTSLALIVTTTAGLIGAILYPIIADAFNLSNLAYGIFCGSTLQQMGIVKLAASNLGDAAIAFAVPVKLVRIAMLAPIALFLAGTTVFASGFDRKKPASTVKVLKRLWFLPLFVAVAVIFTFVDAAAGLRESVEPLATIFMALALASIGLTVDFNIIKSSGPKPLLIGLLGWALVALLILATLIPLIVWEG